MNTHKIILVKERIMSITHTTQIILKRNNSAQFKMFKSQAKPSYRRTHKDIVTNTQVTFVTYNKFASYNSGGITLLYPSG